MPLLSPWLHEDEVRMERGYVPGVSAESPVCVSYSCHPVGVSVGTQACPRPESQGRVEAVSDLSGLRAVERFCLLLLYTSVCVKSFYS